MLRHPRFVVAVAALWMMMSAASCYASKLKIGDSAPDWQNLPGVDGKTHSLSDYSSAKAIVLVFTCNHCPVARAYQDRIIAFQSDYKDKGVQVIAINVNDIPADRLDAMKKRAKSAKFNFPYLFDESQKTGRDYGATCTPHFFLLDANRKLAYTGAMDDSMAPDKVKERYLRDAVDAVLAGKEPPKTVTRQRGCGIKWK